MNLIEAIKLKDIPRAIQCIKAGDTVINRCYYTTFYIKLVPNIKPVFMSFNMARDAWRMVDKSRINLYNFLIRVYK